MSETPLRSMMCVYGNDIILVYVCIRKGGSMEEDDKHFKAWAFVSLSRNKLGV